MTEMEFPQIRFDKSVVVGLAIGAAVLAIVLYYENRSLRKDLVQMTGQRKPCNCQDKQSDNVVPIRQSNRVIVPAGIHESVVTGRLDSQPMPMQDANDPDHPPEIVL